MMRIRFELKKPSRLGNAFCNYIIKWLRTELLRNCDYTSIQLRLDLLQLSSWIDWMTPSHKVTSREFIRLVCQNIKWRRVRNSYIIYIDEHIMFPGTRTPLYRIVKFVDNGNELVRGTFFLTILFSKYQQHIYEYWSAFKIMTQH